MNNKGADQTAWMLFAYGINRFSHDMAEMKFCVPKMFVVEGKDTLCHEHSEIKSD